MDFRRVGLVGTGLIGASLGLAIRRLHPAPLVVGYDLHPDRAEAALERKAVDRTADSLADVVDGSDLLVLSVPVRASRELLREVAPLLADGTIVTDTGSTKREVIAWAEEYLPTRVSFVGGHPMAGRLTAGTGEDEELVELSGIVYCLTPSSATPQAAIERVAALVAALGAQAYLLDGEEHDALVAAVSHLPYLAASALISALADDPGWEKMRPLAAGGFDTATRLVEGDPRVFADICLTNRGHVARRVDQLIRELERIRDEVARGDERLVERFSRAREERAGWQAARRPDR